MFWVSFYVDVVLECIGLFCLCEVVIGYISVGVKWVIIGVVFFDLVDVVIVYGVNYYEVKVSD